MPKIKFSTKSHKIKTKTKSTQIYLICSLKASYFKVYYLKIETGTYFIQLCFQEKKNEGTGQKERFSVTPSSNCLSNQCQKSKVVLFAFKVNGGTKLL